MGCLRGKDDMFVWYGDACVVWMVIWMACACDMVATTCMRLENDVTCMMVAI